MPLAQLNLAMPNYPLEDPRMAGFTENVARINGVAERMPGYLWRFPEEPEGHPDHEPLPWPGATLTLSLWAGPDALRRFVWGTVHRRFFDRRVEWFTTMATHHLVLWTVAEGHRPTLAEAKERLDHRDAHGDSDFAFGWAHLQDQRERADA